MYFTSVFTGMYPILDTKCDILCNCYLNISHIFGENWSFDFGRWSSRGSLMMSCDGLVRTCNWTSLTRRLAKLHAIKCCVKRSGWYNSIVGVLILM